MNQNNPVVKLHSAIMHHTGIMLYADTREDFWLTLGPGLGWGRFTRLYADKGFKEEDGALFRLAEVRPESEGAPAIIREEQLWGAREALDVEIQGGYLKDEYRVEKITPVGGELLSNQTALVPNESLGPDQEE